MGVGCKFACLSFRMKCNIALGGEEKISLEIVIIIIMDDRTSGMRKAGVPAGPAPMAERESPPLVSPPSSPPPSFNRHHHCRHRYHSRLFDVIRSPNAESRVVSRYYHTRTTKRITVAFRRIIGSTSFSRSFLLHFTRSFISAIIACRVYLVFTCRFDDIERAKGSGRAPYASKIPIKIIKVLVRASKTKQ